MSGKPDLQRRAAPPRSESPGARDSRLNMDRLNMESDVTRRTLVELLKKKALRRLDEPVRLASGEWSREFVDGKEALADYADLELACKAIVEQVRANGIQFDAVGGLTLGDDALAVGVAAVARCKWFFVRKEPKDSNRD
jgi:orotate phosphoribosyltransferase